MDAKRQADYFIDYVNSLNDNGALPPVLDLETTDGQKKEKIISAAKTWLDRVEETFGKKPIIHSGQYFLQDNFSEAGGGPPAWPRIIPSGWHSIRTITPKARNPTCRVAGSHGRSGNTARRAV